MSTPRDERTADSSNDYVSVLRRGSRFGAAGWLVGIVVSFVLFRSPSLQKYKAKAHGFGRGMKPTTGNQSTLDVLRGFPPT